MKNAALVIGGALIAGVAMIADYFLPYSVNLSIWACVGGLMVGLGFRAWWDVTR